MAQCATVVVAVIFSAVLHSHAVPTISDRGAKDWDLKLIDGYSSNEGTLLVRFGEIWGLLCDDGWNARGADVACRQLGFGVSLEFSVANRYKSKVSGVKIVLDDVICTGRELRLSDCQSRPLGQHNCQPKEAAGVRCSTLLGSGAATGPRPPAWNPLGLTGVDSQLLKRLAEPSYKLQILGRAVHASGGAIVAIVDAIWGGLCPDRVTLREGNVMCRELGLGFANSIWRLSLSNATVEGLSGKVTTTGVLLTVGNCRGSEMRLSQCVIYGSGSHGAPCSERNATVGVNCTADLPDLVPNVRALQTSAYIVNIPMFYMSCAMEENCASPVAFEVRKNNPYWQFKSRTLLRFSTIVANQGTSDFLPLARSEAWSWHACHMHYHSMAYFASYEVYTKHNSSHVAVAGGHKASFCLEDNACKPGVAPRFSCSRDPMQTGVQGISPGCSDNYLHDIDCQWIDITDMAYGVYRFKMVINPEFAAAELSYDNNAVVCRLTYSQTYVQLSGCRLSHPFDF